MPKQKVNPKNKWNTVWKKLQIADLSIEYLYRILLMMAVMYRGCQLYPVHYEKSSK